MNRFTCRGPVAGTQRGKGLSVERGISVCAGTDTGTATEKCAGAATSTGRNAGP